MEHSEISESKTEWPINAMDSKENALKVEERMREKFPEMYFKIISDPKEIENAINHPLPKDKVLIQVVPPLGKWMDVLSIWAESLQGTQQHS